MKQENYYIVIDTGGTVFKIREKAMQKCFNDVIAPLDIIDQVGNDTEMEIAHEIGLEYTKQLENGLMNALDKLAKLDKDFDYYDTVRELTGWGNFQALDYLDMFSDNEGE